MSESAATDRASPRTPHCIHRNLQALVPQASRGPHSARPMNSFKCNARKAPPCREEHEAVSETTPRNRNHCPASEPEVRRARASHVRRAAAVAAREWGTGRSPQCAELPLRALLQHAIGDRAQPTICSTPFDGRLLHVCLAETRATPQPCHIPKGHARHAWPQLQFPCAHLSQCQQMTLCRQAFCRHNMHPRKFTTA